MASVQAGALAGCPVALSGKYRMLDFFGKSYERELNFKDMRFRTVGGSGGLTVTADSAKPCAFVAEGSNGTDDVRLEFVMGPSGVGSYRANNLTTERSIIVRTRGADWARSSSR